MIQCKYCTLVQDQINLQRLKCDICQKYVHCECLRRGIVPGGLIGDVFFHFTCAECSSNGMEQFLRDKMSWLQVICLVLYHLQHQCNGLSRRGFFHWKMHIVSFINKNWAFLFQKDVRPKKNWTGTVAGILSHYSPQFFSSGTPILNEQGWWTLTYSELTPTLISEINAEMLVEKHKYKGTNHQINEIEILKSVLELKSYVTEEMLQITNNNKKLLLPVKQTYSNNDIDRSNYSRKNPEFISKKNKIVPPTIENIKKTKYKIDKRRSKCILKQPYNKKIDKSIGTKTNECVTQVPKESQVAMQKYNVKPSVLKDVGNSPQMDSKNDVIDLITKSTIFAPHQYYYNTSMQDVTHVEYLSLKNKLVGRFQPKIIISPYSYLCLPPYIWRATTIHPPWLQLMDEIKACVRMKENGKYKFETRKSLDFMYLQYQHVAAVNSLCNHYFWVGIDISDALQYPDYTCVVMYKQLIVAFAIVVPNAGVVENYLSFIFTRPEWRNCGIAKYMLYFVIQACGNKDITLHVSLSNTALCLYQKFGFKVEGVVLDFYDKYMRNDCMESKHAFYCRLER